MKKAKDYVIVSGTGLDGLQRNMQEFLSRDHPIAWCPIGEPVYHPDKSGDWHQAVVGFSREEK